MYIIDFCSIGVYGVIDTKTDSKSLQVLQQVTADAQEPDYAPLIAPMQLRRMTKPLRIGVAAAKICLQHSGIEMPQSIHIGTAYGMLADSELFLRKMIDQEEQMLNPTAFIQSTHNTVSGQIALGLGCRAHNMTFVHNAHSFESALLDADVFQSDGRASNYCLLGAVDERIPASYDVLKKVGFFNEETITGEGASFFLASKAKNAQAIAHIKDYKMHMGNSASLLESLTDFVTTNIQKPLLHKDLLLYGTEEAKTLFTDCEQINYKDYCGEYATSISFALSLALLKITEKRLERVWIVNRFGAYFSFMLVTPA